MSSVIANRTTGNSKQSKSGSKRKYQTRNAVNAVRAGSGSEAIGNSEHYMPYLIQLVNSDNGDIVSALKNFILKLFFKTRK